MNRRDFMKLLGLGALTTAAGLVLPTPPPPVLAEPERVRRWWAVPRGAPVPQLRREHRALFIGDPVAYGDDDGTIVGCRPSEDVVGHVVQVNPDGTVLVRIADPIEDEFTRIVRAIAQAHHRARDRRILQVLGVADMDQAGAKLHAMFGAHVPVSVEAT